jgi:general secretion pathway protein G
MKDRSRAQQGLTLFELLVVLAILAFLAALVAPRAISYLGRAKGDIARTQASNLAASLELFFLDFERYPTVEEGLRALVVAPEGAGRSRGPYLKDPAGHIDPWGRAYQYELDGTTGEFAVVSFGRDGAEGGIGEDEDIRKK